MSHATVYKTLALLKDINQVFEIDLHGNSHYDGNRPEPQSMPKTTTKRSSRAISWQPGTRS